MKMITKHGWKVLTLALVMAAALPACKKYNINEFNRPEWEMDLLGPLAFTSMRLEDVNELEGLEYTEVISLADLGIPPITGDIPAISLPDLGPFDIHFFDEFHYVDADSVSLSVTIGNNLPVDFDKGGRVELRNKLGGDLLYSYTFDDTIHQYSSFPVSVILTDVRIEPDIELWLNDFSTLAEDSATASSSNSVSVKLRLEFISISRASVVANTEVIISDTTRFNLKGEDLQVISIDGYFNTYVENGFPFSGELQAYFLTEDSELLDSLFTDENEIAISNYNIATGEVIEPVETKLPIYMDSVRVKKIINSKKIYFRIKLASPSTQPLYADNDYPINAQMVGDLHVTVQNQ